MRIALVGPTHPFKGGIAQHTTRLAHELVARGHQVQLVSWSAQYPALLYPGQRQVDEPEGPVFPGTSYPLSWKNPGSWWRTARRLRNSCDLVVLVVVTPLQAPAWLTMIRALGGTQVLALCHNVLPHERRAIDVRLVRKLLGRVAGVIVHSEAQAATARALTNRPVEVAFLPLHHPFGTGAAAQQIRHSLLFFGLVRPYKGLDVLLRALVDVPDVRLVVAGEFWGGSRGTRDLVRALGLQDRVELRDAYVPAAQVAGLFTACDALVLPYRQSTASQNADIAFGFGVPVVATTVGTMARQVLDGVNGLLCSPEDAPALAKALQRLYEPGMLAHLRAGIFPAPEREQWAAYVDAVERLAFPARQPGHERERRV